MTSKQWHWTIWLVGMLFGMGFLAQQMFFAEDKSLYLIGETTAAHHQIELACHTCHTSEFGGKEVLQNACVGCHKDELVEANDSHPKKKFTDPRNADRVEILDARYCITCHVEHQPNRTHKMALTLPEDYCFKCHKDVGEDRPSHEGMGFETCASAGCHNYHDNRALYEAFLVKHGNDHLDTKKENPVTLTASDDEILRQVVKGYATPLSVDQADAPASSMSDPDVLVHWQASGHMAAGINCSGCHTNMLGEWQETPDYAVCADCHSRESDSFLAGRHGMRLAQGLSPMTPSQAVIPMHDDVADLALNCGTCHAPHKQDTHVASVQACEGCHADQHTQNFKQSKHAALWAREQAGELPEGQSVSCATCHMPREVQRINGLEVNVVNHNQNHNLRPNEKMIRGVCMNCHSLAFSIDALADTALIESNFNGLPSSHINSVDMALERERADHE